MKWFPKKALLFLDISKPNFEKKNRGKKASKYHSIHVNKRLLCVKASRGIWSHWQDQGYHSHNKIDLHNLVQRGLDWGDTLSDEFRPIWTSRFEIIKETMKTYSSNAFNIEYLKYSDSQKNQMGVAFGQYMIVYLEMQRVDGLCLVDNDSSWINCYDWMKKDQKYFQTKSIKTRKWRSISITKGKYPKVI